MGIRLDERLNTMCKTKEEELLYWHYHLRMNFFNTDIKDLAESRLADIDTVIRLELDYHKINGKFYAKDYYLKAIVKYVKENS